MVSAHFMRKALLIVFLFCCLPSAGAAVAKECHRYEPTVVQLTGVLLFRTFADANGNPERSPLLLLDEPICVEGEPNDTINRSEYDVIVIHLVVSPNEFDRLRILTGQRMVASGTFFHNHTAHHHASVLLMVRKFTDAVNKSR